MKKWGLLSLGIAATLFAAPKEAKVIAGTAELQQSSHSLEVKTSERAVINWKDFSIGVGESVRFIQPGRHSAVLNRVQGGDLSYLAGLLEANGRVYLINPSGVIIGREAVINTGAFIASTLDLLDDDFIKGGPLSFSGNSQAFVVNYGSISGCSGDVFLLGRFVRNEGSIEASEGVAGLGVGQEILIKPEGEERLFVTPKMGDEKGEVGLDNSGRIAAIAAELKADGNAYKLAINQSGIIEATGTVNRDGKVYLVADQGINTVGGKLSAHNANDTGGTVHLLGKKVGLVGEAKVDVTGLKGGGTVLIGGDYQGSNPAIQNAELTVIEAQASIDASALEEGNGGKIIAWADRTCAFVGNAKARGGSQSGDGGLVEASGKINLNFNGLVDTRAPHGITGQLLLDPTDVELHNIVNDVNATFSNGTYTYSASPALLSYSKLATNLQSTNVLITTSGNTGGSGMISMFDAGTTYSAPNNLTLQADSNVSLLTLHNTGSGGLTITGASISSAANAGVIIGSDNGPLTLNSVGDMLFTPGRLLTIGSLTGAVNVNCGGNFQLIASTGVSFPATFITSSGNSVFNIAGSLTIQGGGNASPAQIGLNSAGGSSMLFNIGGNVTLLAGTGGVAHAQIGHTVALTNATQFGNITMNVGGNISLTGNSQSVAQIGHYATQGGYTGVGDITINQAGNISLLGGSPQGPATIGHGNQVVSASSTLQGTIRINQQRPAGTPNPAISLVGGDQQSSAIIGFDELNAFAPPVSIITSPGIFINTNGPIQLTSGTSTSHAIIGFFNLSAANSANVSIGTVEVSTTKDIALTANTAGVLPGNAVIGTSISTSISTGNTATCNVAINAGGTVTLNGRSNPSNRALIINNIEGTTGPFDINIQANNLIVGGNSAVSGSSKIFASRKLQAIANVDIQLLRGSTVTNGSGEIDLVVDNAFPSPTGKGPGKFVIQSNASLTVHSPLRIFTSMRTQNQIGTTLNGAAFVPGPYLVNSATEQWGTYFPSSFGGVPFTIFYKDQIPAYYGPYGRAISENFHDLRTYDDLLFVPRCFLLRINSNLDDDDQIYEMLRPIYHNYELKHFDNLP